MTTPDLNAIVAAQTSQVKDLLAAVKAMADEMARVEKLQIPLSESSRVPAVELQVYNRPLRLLTAVIYNLNLATLNYVQFHNTVSRPINGSSCDLILPVPANSVGYLDFREGPFFSNGLYICGSSTDTIKTTILTNDLTIFCTFRAA
jgi:hypothetical protein